MVPVTAFQECDRPLYIGAACVCGQALPYRCPALPLADELTRVGVAFADISAIFLTHLHGDHINGLVHFIDLSNWYYRDSDPQIFTPSLDLKTGLEAWMRMLTGNAGREFRYTEIGSR